MCSQLSAAVESPALYTILAGERLPLGGAQEVGNKAWNLMRMAEAGLPVPPAFVLPTTWSHGSRAPGTPAADLRAALIKGIRRLELATGLGFGSPRKPLLVSVRSGAAISMPGMMETVLDVGVNNETVDGLVRLTGNPRLAWDSYRRLVQGFAEVVQGLPTEPFDALIQEALAQQGEESERMLDHRVLRQLTRSMLLRFQEMAGMPFPQAPADQLARATDGVFRSWDAPKAAEYRRLNHIDDDMGTAVTVQTMVFGNAGGTSGAGVGFTRDPATGENTLYLDFQFNGQGEDVVAGRVALQNADLLRATLPSVWEGLEAIRPQLETMFGDVQDFEFTVQEGRLHLLQTRKAKRTPWAALKIAVDLVEQGLITPEEALQHLEGIDLDRVALAHLSGTQDPPSAHAIVAGIGVAAGRIAFDTTAAKHFADHGEPAILVRRETSTSDIAGMENAAGILTALGGRTSHAAVVARQLAKVCLVGCADLSIDPQKRTCRVGQSSFAEGDWLTLDGNSGVVFGGRLEVVFEKPERALASIMGWRAAENAGDHKPAAVKALS
jgi:pyruvate,orthophosphate dikinase